MCCTIENLRVISSSGEELVKGVSFSLEAGESLGLVGESGSGKTLTCRSVIGLLPEGLRAEADRIRVTEKTAMIFQNPIAALDPLCPVFRQLCEVIEVRQRVSGKEAAALAAELFRRLSLPEELAEKKRYPWELSGGQCQRIGIALALACRPELLICDEPTTALDVTVQKQTIDLIRELQRELHFAMIFVTHNLAVASQLCDRLAVMQEGRIVETGPRHEVLGNPKHEYTKKLIDAILTVPAGAERQGTPEGEAGQTG